MILDVWKPIFKGSCKSKKVVFYQRYPLDLFLENKQKGYVITYTCDRCDSKKIHNTTSSCLLGFVYNTLDKQTCRSCRSKISEYEIKQTQIKYEVVQNSFQESNYILLTDKTTYDVSENKSQLKLKAICDNDHHYSTNWNNWSKGKRCRKCYDLKRKDDAVSYKEGFSLYKYLVIENTNKTYKKFKHIIDNDKKRSKNMHIDHIYSIYDGFINNVPVYIISSLYNLRLIPSSDNMSKGKRSDISLDELCERVYKRI